MYMKKRIYRWYDRLLSFLLAMLGFSGTLTLMGCPAEYGPDPGDHRIKVNPDRLYFYDNENVTQVVYIQTDGNWYVNKVSPFISVTPISGNYSTMTVEIAEKILENTNRQGLIIIQSVEEPQYSDTVIVYQYKDRGYDWKSGQ